MLRNSLITIAIGVLCLTSACGPSKRRLTIGAKTSTEQTVLAEILSQHLAAKMAVDAPMKLALGQTATTHQALLMNEVDLYIENVGALSALILKEAPDKDPGIVMERVKTELDRTAKVQILDTLGIENPFVMVIREKDGQERKVRTLSEAAEYKTGWDLATTSDFQSRADGNTAMQTGYSLPLKSVPTTRQPEEMFRLLNDGYITMVAATNIDGHLVDPALRALEDDKHAFPPAGMCVLVRLDTAQAFPDLKGTIAQLKGKLTLDTLRKLNYQVDVKHRQPKDVAADFLAGRAQ